MNELRARMIRDMTVRGFSPRTHEAYIRQVVGLARYYHRSPDQLSADEVQAYVAQVFTERKCSWSTCAQAARRPTVEAVGRTSQCAGPALALPAPAGDRGIDVVLRR
jgi:hypothetical protein